MDRANGQPTEGGRSPANSRIWLLGLAAVIGLQGWLTSRLFGDERPWASLLNDQPIVCGRHALHLYHGSLGAEAFANGRRTLAYDPSFNAGYPKTPWFDAGSKPAEFFLWTTGGGYNPDAYKVGLASCLVLLPLVVFVAARTAGLIRAASVLAAFLCVVATWSEPGRQLLRNGDTATLVASPLGCLLLALLARYHRSPKVLVCGAAGLVCWAVCFFHPLMLAALLPALFLFYLAAGPAHRLLWHGGLGAVFAVGVGGNWAWLRDAARSWWVCTAAPQDSSAIGPMPSTLADLIGPAWTLGHSSEQALVIVFAGLAILGVLALIAKRLGTEACVLAVAGLVQLFAGLSSDCWAVPSLTEAKAFSSAALLLACIPAAQGFVAIMELLGRLAGSRWRGALLAGLALGAAAWGLRQPLTNFAQECLREERLPLSLPAHALATVEQLRKATTSDARILWEERPEHDDWSPLLATATQRAFIGGLGLSAAIEHAAIRLAAGRLAGKPLDEWSDTDLAEYCRRYNVGWVVCHSPEALSRFRKWPAVRDLTELATGGRLLAIDRPLSFFLAGQGRVVRCDNRFLTLADVTPVDGQVILSFHYHAGIIPSADRIRVEREPQLYGSVPLIRLRLSAPMTRLTLYWQE